MTIDASGEQVRLIGRCGAEDAEPLLETLLENPRPVDLNRCEHLHTALVQILWAAGAVIAPGGGPMLPAWLCRLLDKSEGSAKSPGD